MDIDTDIALYLLNSWTMSHHSTINNLEGKRNVENSEETSGVCLSSWAMITHLTVTQIQGKIKIGPTDLQVLGLHIHGKIFTNRV